MTGGGIEVDLHHVLALDSGLARMMDRELLALWQLAIEVAVGAQLLGRAGPGLSGVGLPAVHPDVLGTHAERHRIPGTAARTVGRHGERRDAMRGEPMNPATKRLAGRL